MNETPCWSEMSETPCFSVGQVVVYKDYYKREHLMKVLRIEGSWNKEGEPPVFVYSVRNVKSTDGYLDLVEPQLCKPTEPQLKAALHHLKEVRVNGNHD